MDPVDTFYATLFRLLDTQSKGRLQGGQVSIFFMSSGLHKDVLAAIWDEATQKQQGGLDIPKFKVAMQLITLAQQGIPPKLANLKEWTPPPRLQYPMQVQPPIKGNPTTVGGMVGLPSTTSIVSSPTSTTMMATTSTSTTTTMPPLIVPGSSGVGTNKSQADPFNWVSEKTGEIKSANSSSSMLQSNEILKGQPELISSPLRSPEESQPLTEWGTALSGSGGGGNNGSRRESPVLGPTSNSWYGTKRVSKPLALVQNDSNGVTSPQSTTAPIPGLGRRQSRNAYDTERFQEQLRAAEAREQRAKQQANDARIENERITRENEQLTKEIHEARASQALALKQSQEALQSISPLRIENDKLKEAIKQWEDLVRNKDDELEDLATEVETLRLENKRLGDTTKVQEIRLEETSFSLRKSDAELQDLRNQVKELQLRNEQLHTEKLTFETTVTNFNVKIAKYDDDVKRLERKLRLAQTESANVVVSSPPPAYSSNFSLLESDNKKSAPASSPAPVLTYAPITAFAPAYTSVPVSAPALSPAPPTVSAPSITGNGISISNSNSNSNSNNNSSSSNNNNKIAPVVKETATTKDNFDSMDDDFFGDLPKEPVIPKKESDKKLVVVKEEGANGGDSKEWEDVTVEYESEVDEKFGQEYEKDIWYLSAEDKEKYYPLFAQADTNHDGIVDGQEATRFFGKSKLDRQMLGQVWVVVDSDKKGHLVREQFYAMFHIVLKIMKNEIKPPQTLPECLRTDVIRQIGTTIKKRVKKTRIEKKPVQKKVTQSTPQPPPVQPSAQPSAQPTAQPIDDFDFPTASSEWNSNPQKNEVPIKAEKTTTPGEEPVDDWANFDFDN